MEEAQDRTDRRSPRSTSCGHGADSNLIHFLPEIGRPRPPPIFCSKLEAGHFLR
jgi:hypothetical protein